MACKFSVDFVLLTWFGCPGINPGWPELEGVDYKVAIKTILKDYTGVRVVYGPQGFPRTKDYRIDRVFLEYDKKTFKVVGVARAG